MSNQDSHEFFRDLLIKKLIFNEITPEEDRKLEEHLVDCSICNDSKNTILLNNKILSNKKMPHHSPDFKNKLMNKIRSKNKESQKKKDE